MWFWIQSQKLGLRAPWNRKTANRFPESWPDVLGLVWHLHDITLEMNQPHYISTPAQSHSTAAWAASSPVSRWVHSWGVSLHPFSRLWCCQSGPAPFLGATTVFSWTSTPKSSPWRASITPLDSKSVYQEAIPGWSDCRDAPSPSHLDHLQRKRI